jgi:uncharacterized protein YuzE
VEVDERGGVQCIECFRVGKQVKALLSKKEILKGKHNKALEKKDSKTDEY